MHESNFLLGLGSNNDWPGSLARWDDLAQDLRDVFSWVVGYIDRIVDWRELVLRRTSRNLCKYLPTYLPSMLYCPVSCSLGSSCT